MPKSVIFVTDNHYVASLFSAITKSEDIEMVHMTCRNKAKSIVANEEFLAVLLDFSNPTIADFEYWQDLLQITPTPILTLSTNINSVERILLRQKASVHLKKPLLELLKKIHALQHQDNLGVDRLEISHGVVFDPFGHSVIKNGERITLSLIEFKVLYALIQNQGKAIKNEELMALSDLAENSSLYMCVKRLREKIEQDPKHPAILINQRGHGYVLKVSGLSSDYRE